jgi:hypothetical protein
MDQLTAEQALRELEPLVGEWRLEATGADGEPWPGEGSATFAWHESRAHLIASWSVTFPGAPDGIGMIGCDAANGTYCELYADERGVCRMYDMSIGDGEWRMWREGEPFAQRFTGRFEDDGNKIAGLWEIAEDGTNFRTDFELTYIRIEQPST